MKTIVNIGTDKKNILGVEFDKPFKDITYPEIRKVCEDKIDGYFKIHGWADVTPKKK